MKYMTADQVLNSNLPYFYLHVKIEDAEEFYNTIVTKCGNSQFWQYQYVIDTINGYQESNVHYYNFFSVKKEEKDTIPCVYRFSKPSDISLFNNPVMHYYFSTDGLDKNINSIIQYIESKILKE